MQYLIYYEGKSFYSKWYQFENNYMPGMIIFDLRNRAFSNDGFTWTKIEEDHL